MTLALALDQLFLVAIAAGVTMMNADPAPSGLSKSGLRTHLIPAEQPLLPWLKETAYPWDYPFSLKYENTSVVLGSGKGSGPFSGPAGARSVASEFAKLLKACRVTPPQSAGKEK